MKGNLESQCLYYNKSRRIQDKVQQTNRRRDLLKVQHYTDRGCLPGCPGYNQECPFYINHRNFMELKRGYKYANRTNR